jgi:hypothetical protein
MGDGKTAADRKNRGQQGSGNDNVSSHSHPPCLKAVQQEPEDIPLIGGIPTVGQGTADIDDGADGLTERTSEGGLRPPVPSSVEPNGIPTRPTDDGEPIPVGDEADAAGPDTELVAMPAQVPDAVPAVPPPSKIVVEPDVPAADVAMPADIPAVGPPRAEHALPGAALNGDKGDTPDVIGLTPGDASSVAPRGIPVGATAGAGPMPSGDVMPSGDTPGDVPTPPTCAAAGPQPRSAATVAAIKKRVIVVSPRSAFGARRAP